MLQSVGSQRVSTTEQLSTALPLWSSLSGLSEVLSPRLQPSSLIMIIKCSNVSLLYVKIINKATI